MLARLPHQTSASSDWGWCRAGGRVLAQKRCIVLLGPCRSHSPHGCRGQTRDVDRRSGLADLILVGIGFVAVSAALILYFSVTGALADLRLATIDYNLQYSNETYGGPFSVVLVSGDIPVQRARVDMLWCLGGVGAVLLAGRSWTKPSTGVVLTWVLAAVISIAVNGSRGLPNYFVQANPALALAASAGLATLVSYGVLVRFATASLLVAALWRVGSDTPVWGLRLASMPGLISNVGYDLRYIAGDLDRGSSLRRFKGQKHDAFENDALASHVRDTTLARGRDLRVRVLGRQRRLEERAAELVTVFLEPARAHRVCRGSPGIRLGGPP